MVLGTLTDANSRALLVCNGPLEHYDFLIKQEELRNDEQQRKVVQHLQKLHESLKGYSISSKNFLSKVRLMMINIFLEFIFSHKNVLKNISISIINLVLFLQWVFTAKSFFVFGSAT